MTNHNPHNRNHDEQRQDERPFTHILKRALLQQQPKQQPKDRNIDTTQHRSATQEYQITIKHGSIWLGQER